MRQHPFEEHLGRIVAPTASDASRVRAKELALAEFRRAHADDKPAQVSRGRFKDFMQSLRPTRANQPHGRARMNWATRNTAFGMAASVSVAIFATTLLWPIVMRQSDTSGETNMSPARRALESLPPPAESVAEPAPLIPIPVAEIPIEVTPPVTLPSVQNASPATAIAGIQDPGPPPRANNVADAPESIVVTAFRRQATPMDVALPVEVVQTSDVLYAGNVAVVGNADTGRFPNRYLSKTSPRIPGAAIPPQTGDEFEHFETNPVELAAQQPHSTFSIDVDTASYSYTRARLNEGVLPQKDAVRAEEMINYFDYAWPAARSTREPFKPTIVVTDSPWGKGKKLIHIGIKGYEIQNNDVPDANLVFLLDVSGSMNDPKKLPLVKESLRLLLSSLKPTDTVSIAAYAGQAGMVLPPTEVKEKQKILSALDALEAGGSTAGSEGIKLAYEMAEGHFRKGGVNRIILATDGDFNVGITDEEELKGYVERQRAKGIFLSVLGFGEGNYHDEMAQALAQNGNGVAAYIDTVNEARKVLVQEASASLFTIAKDVKVQVEFNPATVAEYRLIGYETRSLQREDFDNDAVDAGDIGSGHTVTAIYEITPADSSARTFAKERYTSNEAPRRVTRFKGEYGYLKIRYKLPDEDRSDLIEEPILITKSRMSAEIRRDVQFSTAVAGFAQLLRGGTYTGSLMLKDIVEQAQTSRGEDLYGYRAEFVELAKKAQTARAME